MNRFIIGYVAARDTGRMTITFLGIILHGRCYCLLQISFLAAQPSNSKKFSPNIDKSRVKVNVFSSSDGNDTAAVGVNVGANVPVERI